MDVRRILAVKAAILDRPKDFDMTMWHRVGLWRTKHCLAGMTVALFGSRWQRWWRGRLGLQRDDLCVPEQAAMLLGMSYSDTRMIFYITLWPNTFQVQYAEAKTARERAEVAGRVIDNYLFWHADAVQVDRYAAEQDVSWWKGTEHGTTTLQ